MFQLQPLKHRSVWVFTLMGEKAHLQLKLQQMNYLDNTPGGITGFTLNFEQIDCA